MTGSLDVVKFIDDRRVGRFQFLVLALCFCIMIIDGFEAQAAAFVAPMISVAWGVAHASFGPAFAAGLLGMALGAMLFGAMADRLGRKVIIVVCFVAFGVLTIAKAYVGSIGALTILQLLAGFGIGGAMPNAVALISEYSPARRRALMVTLAVAGYSLGAAGAGFLTARVAGTYGWQATFIVGGAASLLLVPVLIWLLPDSIRFLVLSGASAAKVRRLLTRIDPRLSSELQFAVTSSEQKLPGLGVSHLFREGRGAMTAFLWLAVFMDLLVIYYMASWLVVTMHSVGNFSVEEAAVVSALFSVAGLFGAPAIGQLMDRFGAARMLGLSFFLASAFIALSSSFASSYLILRILMFMAGFFSIGAHLGVNALAGELYPTFMRGTGIGWALGCGRIGSLISPMLGGVMLSWHWQLPSIFLAVATPAFFASICVLLAGRLSPKRGRVAATPTAPVSLAAPPRLTS